MKKFSWQETVVLACICVSLLVLVAIFGFTGQDAPQGLITLIGVILGAVYGKKIMEKEDDKDE